MFLFTVRPTIVVSDTPAKLKKILAKLSIQTEIVTNPTNVESIASLDKLTVEGENF